MVREKFVLFAIFVRSDINSLIAVESLGKQFCEEYLRRGNYRVTAYIASFVLVLAMVFIMPLSWF